MKYLLLLILIRKIEAEISNRIDVNNDCDSDYECDDEEPTCGIRSEGEGFRIRLFANECALTKFRCQDESLAYGIVNMFYCNQSFKGPSLQVESKDCIEFDCSFPTDAVPVCAIRKYGDGFRIRIFQNKCKLWKYNCENEVKFYRTQFYICNTSVPSDINDLRAPADDLKALERDIDFETELTDTTTEFDTTETQNTEDDTTEPVKKPRHIFLVSDVINAHNINESIDNFFAATHVFDLPIRDIGDELNETTRRMLVRNAGPVKVYKPWVVKPKNVSEDYDHTPTLSSCYHKCPTKCPDSYVPVCGVPGNIAREPSLMFQNHCFMDVAQCKMFREDKSITSSSSAYIEGSFIFCLGDELSSLYRFLPLIRTLQHMGRLKNKGHFRYKLKNMRFFNNYLSGNPKVMG